MSYLEKAQDLQQMIGSGQVMEAFEKYYHNEVQVLEVATGEHRNGKDAQREAINGWVSSIKEFHGSGCNSITSDEDNGITTAETWTDVTFQDGNRMQMKEVAVQKWKEGQIIEEKFYYNMPGQ